MASTSLSEPTYGHIDGPNWQQANLQDRGRAHLQSPVSHLGSLGLESWYKQDAPTERNPKWVRMLSCGMYASWLLPAGPSPQPQPHQHLLLFRSLGVCCKVTGPCPTVSRWWWGRTEATMSGAASMTHPTRLAFGGPPSLCPSPCIP